MLLEESVHFATAGGGWTGGADMALSGKTRTAPAAAGSSSFLMTRLLPILTKLAMTCPTLCVNQQVCYEETALTASKKYLYPLSKDCISDSGYQIGSGRVA